MRADAEKHADVAKSSPPIPEGCFSADRLDRFRHAQVLTQADELRIVRHLSQPCAECLVRLHGLEVLRGPGLSNSAVVRALRTPRDYARLNVLAPQHRAAFDAIRDPLGFFGLVILEAAALPPTQAKAELLQWRAEIDRDTYEAIDPHRWYELRLRVRVHLAAVWRQLRDHENARSVVSEALELLEVAESHWKSSNFRGGTATKSLLWVARADELEADSARASARYTLAVELLQRPECRQSQRPLRIELLVRHAALLQRHGDSSAAWKRLRLAEIEFSEIHRLHGRMFVGLYGVLHHQLGAVAFELAKVSEQPESKRRVWLARALGHLEYAKPHTLEMPVDVVNALVTLEIDVKMAMDLEIAHGDLEDELPEAALAVVAGVLERFGHHARVQALLVPTETSQESSHG